MLDEIQALQLCPDAVVVWRETFEPSGWSTAALIWLAVNLTHLAAIVREWKETGDFVSETKCTILEIRREQRIQHLMRLGRQGGGASC